jgi:hypothetical protein
MLREVVPLGDPIPWKGGQGWFDMPDELFPAAARAESTIEAPPVAQLQAAWPFPVSAHVERRRACSWMTLSSRS